MLIVGLAVAGALGAVLRYLVDHLVQRRADAPVPLGIMAVNRAGRSSSGCSSVAGLHHGVSASLVTVAGTGLIGSYTTFSTFTFDTVRLAEDGRRSSVRPERHRGHGRGHRCGGRRPRPRVPVLTISPRRLPTAPRVGPSVLAP